MFKKQKNLKSAFTIVELLIVIVVIGILASITIVAYSGIQNRARDAVMKSDLRQASAQLELALIDSNSYPADISSIDRSDNVNFQYTSDGSTYCVTVTVNGSDSAFYITSTSGDIQEGSCPGHSGGGGGSIAAAQASGGSNVYELDGYRYHQFTSSGSLEVTSGGELEYLVVAGGGGGASFRYGSGGGGGAGGVLMGSVELSTGTIPIVVGSGGSGGTNQNGPSSYLSATSGSNSSLGSELVAIGGGFGANSNFAYYSLPPGDGGSGGGAAGEEFSPSVGAGTSGQGNDGGFGSESADWRDRSGGGGGGASQAGSNGLTGTSGVTSAGGDGIEWPAGSGNFYAGGGGGGINNRRTTQSPGGLGGGGFGTKGSAVAGSGAANTGSGGGGSGVGSSGTGKYGGDGGSGVVIIRYRI